MVLPCALRLPTLCTTSARCTPLSCIHVQDTLQELANQQARLVQQHEQQAQEDQQQQQPVQDPNRRPIWSVNGINNNDVTQLREALQQHHGEVQRELVERLGAQGRELPAAVALAVQQQMGRRDVATGALLGAAVVLVSEASSL